MKKILPVVWFIARVFLGAVFVYSGFMKLTEPVENFRAVLAESYPLIPDMFYPVITLVFPWFEFIFGVFLILGFLPRLSGLVLAGFSWGFVMILAATKITAGAFPADCGCFGEGGIHLSGAQVIFLDTVNTFFGLMLFSVKEHFLSLDNILRKR